MHNKEYNKNMDKEILTKKEEIEDDFCDLDPKKICDNCCKCIETDKNYKIIKITKVITNEE